MVHIQNFISAHATYAKARSQSSMTLKQASQANKKFLMMIEERGGAAHSVSSLDRALDGPVDFVIELRLKIASLLDEGAWSSKETRLWSGISRNLQPVCREEEREVTQRSQENKLFQLELRILELSEKISRPGRFLVLASSINLSTILRASSPALSLSARLTPAKLKWIEMEVVLTNDSILFLKKSKRHKGMFDFKTQHALSHFIGAELGSPASDLRLTTLESVYNLRFESQLEAEKWYAEIKMHLPEQLDHAGSDREDSKPGSDVEEADSKKKKKRSATNSVGSEGAKVTSLKFSDPQPLPELPKPRSSTDSKRSKFTKSLSVSTITSDVSESSSRIHPRRMSKQRTTAETSTRDEPSYGSTFSSSDENGPQKRRRSAKTPDAPNVSSAANTTPLPPLSPISPSSHSMSRIEVPRLPLGFTNHIKSASSTSPTMRPSPTPQLSDSLPPKYPARLSRVLDKLEGSSDYEESEDEPKRLFAPSSPFVKPGLRDPSLARNMQSSSVRELRSGSIDDYSARGMQIRNGFESSESQTDSRSATPTPVQTTPHLPVELVVSTIMRMESDLALLRKLLSDSGIIL